MTRSRSASDALRSGEPAGWGGSPVGGMSAGTSSPPFRSGSSGSAAVHAGEITLHRALAGTSTRAVKVARQSLGIARASHLGADPRDDLVGLVLTNFDELVLQVTAF
jgi:hypothetical protein